MTQPGLWIFLDLFISFERLTNLSVRWYMFGSCLVDLSIRVCRWISNYWSKRIRGSIEWTFWTSSFEGNIMRLWELNPHEGPLDIFGFLYYFWMVDWLERRRRTLEPTSGRHAFVCACGIRCSNKQQRLVWSVSMQNLRRRR